MMTNDWSYKLALGGATLALAAACSADGGEGRGFRGGKSGIVEPCSIPVYTCPDSGTPSYEKDVVPILNARCNGCHGNGGQEAVGRNLTTWANVKKYPVQNQVGACLMPPRPLAPLAPNEEATLLTWLVCGSPDN